MRFTEEDKRKIKLELVERLSDQPEVRKVVVFGSFTSSLDPQDLDVAVFQDSDQSYLPLAMKYRRLTRPIARQIPMDIVPMRPGVESSNTGARDWFLEEINRGEVIFER
jgi:hypothetical protein